MSDKPNTYGWQHTGQKRPDFALEPGPGEESVWDYPRPPAIVAFAKNLEVIGGSRASKRARSVSNCKSKQCWEASIGAKRGAPRSRHAQRKRDRPAAVPQTHSSPALYKIPGTRLVHLQPTHRHSPC